MSIILANHDLDDLIATGGSLVAAKKVSEMFGATVVGCVVMLQVEDLVEKAMTEIGCELVVVLDYFLPKFKTRQKMTYKELNY